MTLESDARLKEIAQTVLNHQGRASDSYALARWCLSRLTQPQAVLIEERDRLLYTIRLAHYWATEDKSPMALKNTTDVLKNCVLAYKDKEQAAPVKEGG